MKLAISRIHLLLALLSLLLSAIVAASLMVWKINQSLLTQLSLEQPTLVEVAPGTSYYRLLSVWQQQGLLPASSWRRYAVKLDGSLSRVKSGTYQLQPGMSFRQALDLLISGVEHQFAITLLEGMNFREVKQQLAAAPRLKQQLVELGDEQLMAELGAAGEHPEGAFFPDTYHYVAGTSDLQLLQRAYRAMQQTLQSAWSERADDLPYSTPYEALIMASIIEKETGDPSERPLIASVFINRLHKGMRLQTDPTVIYGMGERFNGNITRRDLREATPYNTYVIRGMPPTPIAMPSRAAIYAAVNPVDSDYFYFVSKGNGTHYFSRSLAEHNRAVRKYILNRQ